MIRDLAFTAYAVRDVPKAAAFYSEIVGLERGESFGEGFVEFNVGSGVFALDGEPPGYEPGSCNGVAFEVDDIVAAHERLVRNNVNVTQVYEFPNCSACFVKDPDGNGFTLHQRKIRSA